MLCLGACKKSDNMAAAVSITPPVVYAIDSPIKTDAAFYSVTGYDSSSPNGEVLMAVNSGKSGLLLFTDRRGSLIREKTMPIHVEDLQKWNVNGLVRYSYFQTRGNPVTLENIQGTEVGYEMICDSDLTIIDSAKLISYHDIDASVSDKLDVHEFILLGDHHYITESYYVKTPTNIPDSLHPIQGVRVAACIIQEIDNGQVVFQWDGSDYPELYSSSQENNNFRDTSTVHDYMHLNSICVDSADNNLIVSFRNLDEIVKLNRQSGDIMWRLGGNNSDFPQTADQLFLRQHYPRLTDHGKTLIFVDNGLITGRAFTRILEFQLDESAKTISGFKAYHLPTPFIQFAGSVKKEGDYYFIGGGAGLYAAEVNYTTNKVLMQMTLKYDSYRALKY